MTIRKKAGEKLDEATLDRVSALLNQDNPITKKEACEMLNISYNTTRLGKILDDFNETASYREVRKSQNRGKKATDMETKEAIEEILNNMMNDLCEIFRGFTVMGGEVLYPEQGDNPWEHPETIYLEVSAPKVSLEDLNPNWTEDEYHLVD